jgi:hypothetical protein
LEQANKQREIEYKTKSHTSLRAGCETCLASSNESKMGLTTAGRKRPEIEWKRIMKPPEYITFNDKNLLKQRYS